MYSVYKTLEEKKRNMIRTHAKIYPKLACQLVIQLLALTCTH